MNNATGRAKNKSKKKKPTNPSQGSSLQASGSSWGGRGSGGGNSPAAARVTARKRVVEGKRAVADREYNMAVKLYNGGAYELALESLKTACKAFKTQPRYAMKLAETFMKLGRFHDAIDMATFHIAVLRGGSTFHSRLLRADAFIQTKQYGHAAADLINCRNENPSSTEVAASIEQLHGLWDVDDEYFDRHPEEAKKEAVYRDLAPCTANFDLDCESDTEDSTHLGFGAGKPCLAYNHGYCRYGRNCRSRHAPDSRSIRDRLGHNVCVFSILGRCHFAAGSRCWYSHSTDNLPEHGWWRDPEYIEYYRTVYDILKATESTSVMDLMLGGDMNGRWLPFERRDRFAAGVASLGGSESFRSDIMDRCEQARAGLISRPDPIHAEARMFGSGRLGRRRSDWDEYDYSDYEVYSDHSDGEFGDMLEEMMSQGIKPWDDDFGFY